MACRADEHGPGSWRWQLAHRITTTEGLSRYLRLTPAQRAEIEAAGARFRWAVTPYFASLMDPDDPDCPIRRQVVPSAAELEGDPGLGDPLAEDSHSPVPGLVHKYPDRVVVLVTMQCAAFCRHCTRRRLVGQVDRAMTPAGLRACVEYIRRHEEVRDVLVTGGDPLVGSDAWLEHILRSLRAIPHVEVLRIGTRVPVTLPQRVTPELCSMLERYHPLWVNIHFNHPRELTEQVAEACDLLTRAGIPLGSQTVLLHGVNDDAATLKALFHGLVRLRVRPYYLYQCDPVRGTSHFWTPLERGLELVAALRGFTSGFSVPTFVVDSPLGKVQVAPQNFLGREGDEVILRAYTGETCRVKNPAPGRTAAT
ncbi:MAG: KamA family radical SAM protein [Firmicutes bacterium]|nr:KamA family radical SAM protein [Bacillota bacterium]